MTLRQRGATPRNARPRREPPDPGDIFVPQLRTPDEAALVEGRRNQPRLARPPRFKKGRDGAVTPAGDPELDAARLAAILHTSHAEHTEAVMVGLGSGLGLPDPLVAVEVATAMVHGIGPRDHVEALLACQMAATHTAALEMLRRGRLPEQPSVIVDACVTRATRLMRTFTAQVAALKDYRSKGHQVVTVQHVDVRDGGRAIVGRDMVLPQKGGGGGG